MCTARWGWGAVSVPSPRHGEDGGHGEDRGSGCAVPPWWLIQ
jgi:hypothetical protein